MLGLIESIERGWPQKTVLEPSGTPFPFSLVQFPYGDFTVVISATTCGRRPQAGEAYITFQTRPS